MKMENLAHIYIVAIFHFNLTIDDITDECYVNGDYLSLRFDIENPYEGTNGYCSIKNTFVRGMTILD